MSYHSGGIYKTVFAAVLISQPSDRCMRAGLLSVFCVYQFKIPISYLSYILLYGASALLGQPGAIDNHEPMASIF